LIRNAIVGGVSGLTVALVLLAVPAAASTIPVDISGIANESWSLFIGGNTIPTGNQMYNGVPFDIPSGSDNGWFAFNGSSPATVTLNIGVANVTTVYTLMDTIWGQPGPASYVSLTFTGSNGAIFTDPLYGNSDIRDFNAPSYYTNSINNTSTINAWTGPNYSMSGCFLNAPCHHRLDEQIITLPAAFATQTLTSLTILDTGNDNFQRSFLAALTVNTAGPASPAPEPSTLTLFGLAAPLVMTARRCAKRRRAVSPDISQK